MKINLLCVLVASSVLMVACRGDYDIKSEEAQSVIQQGIQRGNDIIIAIEGYKTKHGLYPERLEQLVPGFLRVIPVPGSDPGDKYWYRMFPDDVDKPYRYRLAFFVPDTRPVVLELVARDRLWVAFNPAQMYDDTDTKTTHTVTGGWAVQTLYRSSHYKQDNEN